MSPSHLSQVQPNSALVGLAILKVDWEVRGRDYLDAILPMVVEAIRISPNDLVSLPQLQELISSRFGLRFPQNAIRTMLLRAAREGYLKRDRGVYSRVSSECAKLTLSETESRVIRGIDAVTTALISYADEMHRTKWTAEQSEHALLNFLATEDWQVVMSSVESGSVIQLRSPNQAERFIVSSFVYEIRATRPDLWDELETIAKGNMLANALFLPNIDRIEQRFKHTAVYFDTSFLVFAMGYAGPDREAPCKELLELLHDFGATLRCFSNTLNETRGIIEACAYRLRSGRLQDAYGPTIDYFLEKGYSAGDVDLLAARLPEKLAFHRIEVVELPGYESHFEKRTREDGQIVEERVFSNPVDEKALERFLQSEIHYARAAALRHDVECIAAIERLRQGRPVFEVEVSKALFVTTNSALAWASKKFLADATNPGKIPPCISDYSLANLLWLKSPTNSPDLPRKLIIAEAYAATQPPDDLWKTYLAEIHKLREKGTVAEHDYTLLRHSSVAKRAFMDLTKGQAEAFTQGTVSEILAIAHENARADLYTELRKKDEELARAATERENLQKRTTAEQERLSTELQNALERQTARVERLTLRARRIAHWVMLVPKYGILALIIFATALTFPWDLPHARDAVYRYASSALLFAFFILSVSSIFHGTSVVAVLTRAEDRLAKRIQTLIDV